MKSYLHYTVGEAARIELCSKFAKSIVKLSNKQTADRLFDLITCKPNISPEELMGAFIAVVGCELCTDEKK